MSPSRPGADPAAGTGTVAGPGTTLVFDEFERDPRVVTLDTDTARALAQSGLVSVLPAGRDTWTLTTRGHVGSVRVGELTVRVLPHATLGLTALFFLLDHADGRAFLDSSVAARDDDELWPSVADALAALARQALSAGLLRGYRREEDALTTVRGRIRIGDQIRRRPGMTIPLEVTFSEFTPDIAENRILRTAAHRLQFLPELSDDTRRGLSIVAARLADAQVVPMGAPVPTWTPSRLNARYQDALRLADRVVRSMSVEVEDGRAATAAFVTRMPELFERFATAELTRLLDGDGGRVHVDRVVALDAASDDDDQARTPAPEHIAVRTGVVYEVDGEPVTTFVATYPTAGRSRADEHYRLLAACTALGVRRAFLVYPATRRDAAAVPRRIVHTDIELVEYPVDLSGGPAGAREAFADLAARARILAGNRSRHRETRSRHAR